MSSTEGKRTDVLSLGIMYDGEFQNFKPMTGAGPEDDTALGILLIRARELLRERSDLEVEVMATLAEAALAEFLPQLIVGEVEPHESEADVKDSFCGPGCRVDLAMLIAESWRDRESVTILRWCSLCDEVTTICRVCSCDDCEGSRFNACKATIAF